MKGERIEIARHLLSFLASLAAISLWAQRPSPSPVVHADGTVTFVTHCVSAGEVMLEASFGEIEMRREGDRLTCTTSASLPSDMYTYRFRTDDDSIFLDPGNPNCVRDIDEWYNYFVVGGGDGDLYCDNDVPHGAVEQLWYASSYDAAMPQRRLSVYTPAAYRADSSALFPVLYLLHGTGGDEESWLDMGRLAQIMDNMIAAGQCRPMIVVMPNGVAGQDAAPGRSPYRDNEASRNSVASWLGRTEAALPLEVIPFVESRMRVVADKRSRAIAGVSMGGMHAMAVAMNNPSLFDYVGLFSPQTHNVLDDGSIKAVRNVKERIDALLERLPFGGDKLRDTFEKKTQHVDNIDIYEDMDGKLATQFADAPVLYYIAVGRKDPLYRLVTAFRKRLDAAGYAYVYNESDGGHDWSCWRRYLVDFLPRLFSADE